VSIQYLAWLQEKRRQLDCGGSAESFLVSSTQAEVSDERSGRQPLSKADQVNLCIRYFDAEAGGENRNRDIN
jgi:hypothetical protein